MGNEAMAESAGAQHSGAQHSGAEHSGTEFSGAQPSGVQPAGAEPAGAEPAAAEPAGVQPPVSGDGGAAAGARPSLSPSRAGDFLTCPLLYRFRVIDRLPEPPSPAAARGTLVHAVLERLFDEPAASRTPQTAQGMLLPQWDRLLAEEPELAGLFDDDEERRAWLAGARDMLDRYFTLEDPARLEPRHREHAVEAILGSGLLLRGYIDRLDVAAGGEIRIVDYKTGTAPKEEFEARALFQMKFYAVVLWLTRQQVPKLLQLMYLGNGEIVRYAPDESDLRATVRKIEALWRAIERARSTGDWRPRPGRLCAWCAHQAICPAFGGTPPPLPELPGIPAQAQAPGRAEASEAPAAAPAGESTPAGGSAPAGESASAGKTAPASGSAPAGESASAGKTAPASGSAPAGGTAAAGQPALAQIPVQAESSADLAEPTVTP
jgi:putative RecB family exonuclease